MSTNTWLRPNNLVSVEYELLDSCRHLATISVCKQFTFGAIAINKFNGVIERGSYPYPVEQTLSLCEPSCTGQACFHAEERLMASIVADKNLDPRNFVLFVAGSGSDADSSTYSCIPCARQMILHGFSSVYTWSGSEWIEHDPAETLKEV